GTAVLGSRLTLQGWSPAGAVLLACAAILCPPLLADVLRRWRPPVTGSHLLVAVAVQSLAVLSRLLARHDRWLLVPAVAAFAGGLVLYAFALRDFDRS